MKMVGTPDHVHLGGCAIGPWRDQGNRLGCLAEINAQLQVYKAVQKEKTAPVDTLQYV